MKKYFSKLKEWWLEYTIYALIISFAIILIDEMNPTNWILSKISLYGFIILITLIVVTLIAIIFQLGAISAIKAPIINNFDYYILTILVTMIIIVPYEFMGYGLFVKTFVALAILLFSIVFYWVRIHIFNKKNSSAYTYQSNVVDLKDLYEGNFSIVKSVPLFIEEEEVNYDLLGRKGNILPIYSAIIDCNPKKSFVISVQGPWGSGKTTIINNVKRMIDENSENKEYCILLEDFDPWVYIDQETMLFDLLDLILKKTEVSYSFARTNAILKNTLDAVAGVYPKTKLFNGLKRNRDNIVELKGKINYYLERRQQKLVVFIDNLDRTSDNNIVTLFRLIGSVINFERVIYVLSFDEIRVKKAFENQFMDYSYVNKIIQLKFNIPDISRENKLDVFDTCFNNALAHYKVTKKEMEVYKKILEVIEYKFLDLREFKRFLNSAVFQVLSINMPLYKPDLLATELIRTLYPELFDSMKRNSEFFISYDRDYLLDPLKMIMNRTEFNKEAKNYFDQQLKGIDQKTKELLASMFIYVERYLHQSDLANGLAEEKKQKQDAVEQSRISSGRYFDLYFTVSINRHLLINKTVKNFIGFLNDHEFEKVKDCFDEVVYEQRDEDQKEFFDLLRLLEKRIQIGKRYTLVKVIVLSLRKVNTRAYYTLESLVSLLASNVSDEEFYQFVEVLLISDPYNAFLFKPVVTRLKKLDNSERIDYIEKKRNVFFEKIARDRIDIFSDEYYYNGSANEILYCLEMQNIDIKGFVTEIACLDNIFRIIFEAMDGTYHYSGNYYEYIIDENKLNALISKVEINRILAHKVILENDVEYQVNLLFRKLVIGEKDNDGKVKINCNYRIEL